MARHLYLSRITEALYMGLLWSGSHFLDLSQSIRSYSPPKHFLLPLNLQPTWFSAFPYFKSLGMCSFSLILHAFHAFWPRFWGFWNFLGYFKTDEFKISCIMKNLSTDRYLSSFMKNRIPVLFDSNLCLCIWAFFSHNLRHIKGLF